MWPPELGEGTLLLFHPCQSVLLCSGNSGELTWPPSLHGSPVPSSPAQLSRTPKLKAAAELAGFIFCLLFFREGEGLAFSGFFDTEGFGAPCAFRSQFRTRLARRTGSFVSTRNPTSVLPGGRRAPGTGNKARRGDTDATPTNPPPPPGDASHRSPREPQHGDQGQAPGE